MTKKAERRFNRILWAVNPFDDGPEEYLSLSRLFQNLLKIPDCLVYPVFVLSPRSFLYPENIRKSDTSSPEIYPIQKLQQIFRELDHGLIEPPTIIRCHAYYLSGVTQCLLDYANETDASLILLFTNARKGLRRMFLGSFTESLLAKLSRPLLTLSPHADSYKPIRRIFHPCDFGEHSEKGFARALDLAELFQAELHVYYSKPPWALYREYNLTGLDVWQPYLVEHDAKKVESATSEFTRQAKECGVSLQIHIEDTSQSLSEAIIKKAESLASDLIVMKADQRGHIRQFIGSTVRSVVREAHCPVYVFESTL